MLCKIMQYRSTSKRTVDQRQRRIYFPAIFYLHPIILLAPGSCRFCISSQNKLTFSTISTFFTQKPHFVIIYGVPKAKNNNYHSLYVPFSFIWDCHVDLYVLISLCANYHVILQKLSGHNVCVEIIVIKYQI